MPNLDKIYYYPVKALQGIELPQVTLQRNGGLPFDRQYAIGDSSTLFDENSPAHVRKQNLVVQMKHEKLAELKVEFHPENQLLRLQHKQQTHLSAELNSPSGRDQAEAFFNQFMGADIQAPARLLSAPGLAFTDLSHKSVSIINMNSVRALGEKLGYTADHRRFRANFYLENLPAWEEENWLDKELVLGEVRLKVYQITDRCAAINVNPATATLDKTLQGLKQHFGHLNMGVYATVETGGEIATGQSIELGH